MSLHDSLLFLRGFLHDHAAVGSVTPTSRYAARALSSRYAAARSTTTRPLHVLEAGAGTGPVSAVLVEILRPGDTLTLVEREPHFAQRLRERFAHPNVDILAQSVTDLHGSAQFDFIVCSIPFRALPTADVRAILDHFTTLLQPGGELSFLEYIGGPFLRRNAARLLHNRDAHDNAVAIDQMITSDAARLEVKCDVVLRNLPPTRIRHWRNWRKAATA